MTTVSAELGVASPCINVCTIDPGTGWCAGCARTIDEIALWSALDDADKRAVLEELPGRRAATDKGKHGER